ncbi:MAG: glycosyltransferase family 25 protein [Terriglobales bacterium]
MVKVISLPGAESRRRHMQAQLVPTGLEWSFFDAIQVSVPPPEYDRRARRRWYGFDLSPGEIGCFLSHRALWQQCAGSNARCWCVLEDDIELLPGIGETLAAVEAASSWDIVRLMQLLPRHGWVQESLEGNRSLLMFSRQPSGGQGYLITPHAAAVMCAYTRRMYEPVDNALDTYWRHGLNIFCVDPPAIRVAAGLGSSVGARGTAQRPRWPGLKRDLLKGFGMARRAAYNLRRYGRCW